MTNERTRLTKEALADVEAGRVVDNRAVQAWADNLGPLQTEAEYNGLIETIDSLLDEIGDDINHPLNALLDTLSLLAREYEDEHFVIEDADPVDVLKSLMDEHGLTPSQLPEIGSQDVVSEVLCGARHLNAKQIKKLSSRFHVSPTVFLR